MPNNCFIPFKQKIPDEWIPTKFPSPFTDHPNPLCKVAAKELQAYLQNPIDWTYDFGINQPKGSLRIGKMFGVLVVKNQADKLGYLAAFSGKLANKNHHQRFVPPVFDSLTENSFLNIGMAELTTINQQIKAMEAAPNWLQLNSDLANTKQLAEKEIKATKLTLKHKKLNRDKQRQQSPENILTEQLNKESAADRKALKKLKNYWKSDLDQRKMAIEHTGQMIQELKNQRKKKSNGLQQQLFEAYHFLNQTGKSKKLTAIFQDSKRVSGAGECAAPKLLQYAFLNDFRPIALAEFWWGKSPKSKIRKHGNFYPPCEEKCRPILGYMLKGLV